MTSESDARRIGELERMDSAFGLELQNLLLRLGSDDQSLGDAHNELRGANDVPGTKTL